MSLKPHELTAAIFAVREELVSTGRYASFADINAGYCTDFCSDVMERLGLSGHEAEPFELGIDSLMESDDGEPTVMDRALLAEHWPNVRPPEGMDWDDVDAMGASRGFSAGTHVWLCLAGRHYDAEVPEGVDSPFDLPFFTRMAAEWKAERAAPSLG